MAWKGLIIVQMGRTCQDEFKCPISKYAFNKTIKVPRQCIGLIPHADAGWTDLDWGHGLALMKKYVGPSVGWWLGGGWVCVGVGLT